MERKTLKVKPPLGGVRPVLRVCAHIALFFACFADRGGEDTLKKDGVVYVYAVPEKEIKFCGSDTVAILANLCKRPHPFSIKNEAAIDHFAYDIKEDKPHFHSEILCQDLDVLKKVVCLRPRMNNPRIIRQHGYFFLFGIKGNKAVCAELPPGWIKTPLVIPADRKKSILRELDGMGFNEGFFYPDFEHFNNVLRRRYGSG